MLPNQQLYISPDELHAQSAGFQSLDCLAELASSMVYVMWHGRRITNMTNSCVYKNSFWEYGQSIPSFSAFCLNIFKDMEIDESTVYLSLKYVALLIQLNPTMEGSEGSEYRIFVVALILACKFLDDISFANTTWSEVTGMNLRDLNLMEAEFLEGISYRLLVRTEEFNQWKMLTDECHDRLSVYYVQASQFEQEKTLLSILYTIGLRPLQLSESVGPRTIAPTAVRPPVAATTITAGYLYDCHDICWSEIVAASIQQYQYAYKQYQKFMQSVSNNVNQHAYQLQYLQTVKRLQTPVGDPARYPVTHISGLTWDALFNGIYGSKYYSHQQPVSCCNL